jgi:hypothetical protein
MSGKTNNMLISSEDYSSDYTSLVATIKAKLAKVETATIVKVVSVSGGGLGPVGFLDCVPQVARVDGANRSYSRGTLHNLPYLRLQGGANAVIIDPQPGDLGIAVFSSRDISSVKNNRGPSNPGSLRRFSASDGMYLGGILNGVPTQYVSFGTDGIHIHAATIFLEGNIQHNGTFNSNGHDIGSDHRHTASGGAGVGGPPV